MLQLVKKRFSSFDHLENKCTRCLPAWLLILLWFSEPGWFSFRCLISLVAENLDSLGVLESGYWDIYWGFTPKGCVVICLLPSVLCHLDKKHAPCSVVFLRYDEWNSQNVGVFTLQVKGTDYKTHDGTCIRDYIDVTDLVDAHVKALEKAMPGKVGIYNVGTGMGG